MLLIYCPIITGLSRRTGRGGGGRATKGQGEGHRERKRGIN